MKRINILPILLAVVFSLAALVAMLGVLGAVPVLAQDQSGTDPMNSDRLYQPPPDDDWYVRVFYTDPVPIQIKDLSGNIVGEGTHEGEVRCNGGICSQKVELQYTKPYTYSCPIRRCPEPMIIGYEFKFGTLQSVDPLAKRLVVTGDGILTTGTEVESFLVIATFQDNRDGSVSAKYEVSIPEYSVLIPRSPGTIEFDND